jgi:glycosyltransferase involved in cell wall biosynthesis
MKISVIICTHNPRSHYLDRVLTALRNQSLPKHDWDLLVIDNASREPLTASGLDLSWHPTARIIREENLGLSMARMRGMREASASLLVFVDDDNVLDIDYLSNVNSISQHWPQLGVWGGSITPEFEVNPSKYLEEFLGVLAIRKVDTPRWGNVSTCSDAEPWGAGLCVRASVASQYCELYGKSAIQVGDRTGTSVLSGGDTEICLIACNIGLGMGVFPDLKVVHLIPKERVSEEYLIRITEGIQTSLHLVAYKWHGIFPSSPFSMSNVLRLGKNLLLKGRVHRRMDLASIRARLRARRIISGSQFQSK